MSTRSFIGIKNEDGTITAVYCHWDGYPEYNGKMLVENYNTKEKAQELINLGDLSSICERVKPNEDEIHTFDNPLKDVTVAYYRDRNEDWEDVKPKNFETIKEYYDYAIDNWGEYIYLFADNEWNLIREETNICKVKDLLI